MHPSRTGATKFTYPCFLGKSFWLGHAPSRGRRACGCAPWGHQPLAPSPGAGKGWAGCKYVPWPRPRGWPEVTYHMLRARLGTGRGPQPLGRPGARKGRPRAGWGVRNWPPAPGSARDGRARTYCGLRAGWGMCAWLPDAGTSGVRGAVGSLGGQGPCAEWPLKKRAPGSRPGAPV